MNVRITGFDWLCDVCPTGSDVTFTSSDGADTSAAAHASNHHGGDTTGVRVVAVDHESYEDEEPS